MILYVLGVLTGMLSVGLILIFSLLFRRTVERTINQLDLKFTKKGKILEPESEELSDWVETLKSGL